MRGSLQLACVAAALCLLRPALNAQFKTASPEVQPQSAQSYPPPYPNQQAPYTIYGQAGAYPGVGGQPDSSVEPDPAADQQHGVARISVIQGDVNVRRGDSGDLVAAVSNAPLVKQDHIQTSPGSRAEVQIDSANIIRLGQNTDLGFADLEYGRYQVQLGDGSIIFRVFRSSGTQVEIDTPSVAIRPAEPGEYRVSVLSDGTTKLSVRSGRAEIDGPRGSEQILAGQAVLVRGNPSDPEFQNTYPASRDQLDDWSQTRDRELGNAQSYRYVDPSIN